MTAPALRRWAFGPVALTFAVICVGCSTPPGRDSGTPPSNAPTVSASTSAREQPRGATASDKGARELDRGIKSYEEGAYKSAAKQLQAALDLGLRAKADQARAHKYLAFIICVSGREKSCREEFRRALEADSSFDLGPAEIGHPVWGPVFRSVKADGTANPKVR